MNSYAIRTVSNFNVNSLINITKKENSSEIIGIIEPNIILNKLEVQLIKGKKYNVYKCEFYKLKQMEIIADGTPYSEFKEVTKFYVYVSDTEKLLIADVSLAISTPFLKYLRKSNPTLVEFSTVTFDFRKIVQNNALVEQVWFGTKDIHARTKGFNGQEVNRNQEAMTAITNGDATYLKASIDVTSNNQNRKRILGFSKKSGIVVVQGNDPTIDTNEKKLTLLLDSYDTYKSFR